MFFANMKEIFIAQHTIDFRKGADGLLAECYKMEINPYKGECVIFVHKNLRKIKIIGGDEKGLWVLLRRFEGGAIKKIFSFLLEPSFYQISQAELAMLLEGATFEVKAKVPAWNKQPSC
jgi:transposase